MLKFYELALAEIGTVEWKDGSNPKVAQYFRDAGHPEVVDDATAWCAAFVGAMLARAGIKGTGSLLARSYLEWGEPVDVADAKPGDVVVFRRGKSTWQGHVAFFVEEYNDTLAVLGGNQKDSVNITRYGKKNLLGIRRAKEPVTGTPRTPVAVGVGALTGLGIWAAAKWSAITATVCGWPVVQLICGG